MEPITYELSILDHDLERRRVPKFARKMFIEKYTEMLRENARLKAELAAAKTSLGEDK